MSVIQPFWFEAMNSPVEEPIESEEESEGKEQSFQF